MFLSNILNRTFKFKLTWLRFGFAVSKDNNKNKKGLCPNLTKSTKHRNLSNTPYEKRKHDKKNCPSHSYPPPQEYLASDETEFPGLQELREEANEDPTALLQKQAAREQAALMANAEVYEFL